MVLIKLKAFPDQISPTKQTGGGSLLFEWSENVVTDAYQIIFPKHRTEEFIHRNQ